MQRVHVVFSLVMFAMMLYDTRGEGGGGVYEEVMQNHCFHFDSGPVATFNGIGTLGLSTVHGASKGNGPP